MERRRALLGALSVFWMVISGCSADDSTESVVGAQPATTIDVSTTDVSGVGSSADQEMGLPGAEDCADDARPPGTIVVAEPAEWLPINHMANQAQVAVVATIEDVSAPRFTGVALPNDEYGVIHVSWFHIWFQIGYRAGVANVTIKDIDENDLAGVARLAARQGMSTQEFLRRLIAREAARPELSDELFELARKVRAEREPMTMTDFNRVRRRAVRSA